jgi:hypothetical protein
MSMHDFKSLQGHDAVPTNGTDFAALVKLGMPVKPENEPSGLSAEDEFPVTLSDDELRLEPDSSSPDHVEDGEFEVFRQELYFPWWNTDDMPRYTDSALQASYRLMGFAVASTEPDSPPEPPVVEAPPEPEAPEPPQEEPMVEPEPEKVPEPVVTSPVQPVMVPAFVPIDTLIPPPKTS